MKKIICVAIALLLAATPALAQQDNTKTEKKPKKEGGFMKFLKKTTESVTGLDVSRETLFVYPTIGDHKMTVISCKGEKETGTVRFVFGVSYFGSGKYQAQPVIREVYYNKAKQNVIKGHYAHKHHDVTTNTPVAFDDILVGVPTEVVNIERLVFNLNYGGSGLFEARDVPITWE